jgi:hypothetical protein
MVDGSTCGLNQSARSAVRSSQGTWDTRFAYGAGGNQDLGPGGSAEYGPTHPQLAILICCGRDMDLLTALR